MRKFSRWIASLCIKDSRNVSDPPVRTKYGMLEGWVSIVLNFLLAGVKYAAGLYVHSASLIADAVHTLSDSATSIVVIIGFKMAGKRPDREHPFGHGRMESVAAIVVSVLLFVAGIELVKNSVAAIINPSASTADNWIILLVIFTMVIKELMARFSFELGEMIDSDALRADGLHHRSDAWSTLLVVAALVAGRLGFGSVDGYMGILVSLVVFYSGYTIVKDAVNPILGEPPSERTLSVIERVTSEVGEIFGVHGIVSHRYGNTGILSLHIEVSAEEKTLRLHDIADHVEEAIHKKTGYWVVVHVDPVNLGHPRYQEVKGALEEITEGDSRIAGIHDLRIVGGDGGHNNVVFDLCLSDRIDGEEDQVARELEERFRERFPDLKVVIKTDPRFTYNLRS